MRLPAAGLFATLLLVGVQASAQVATGCLSRSGTINKVAIGNEPRSACAPRATEITLQLGDRGGSPLRFRFVGISAATATGGAGIFGLSALCAEEFSGSRVCMSQEFIETVDPPPQPSVLAWIHPTFVGTLTTGGPPARPTNFDRDISGVLASTCYGWSTTSGDDYGLSVHGASGRFFLRSCSQPLSVACCAP